ARRRQGRVAARSSDAGGTHLAHPECGDAAPAGGIAQERREAFMNKPSLWFGAALIVSALGVPAVASAQTSVPASAETTSQERIAYVKTKPNGDLIAAGLFTLGIPYGFSAMVGIQSDVEADRRLLIPVAGPWMNLATRPNCGTGRHQPSCDMEG